MHLISITYFISSQFTSLLPQRMANCIFLNILLMGKFSMHNGYIITLLTSIFVVQLLLTVIEIVLVGRLF